VKKQILVVEDEQVIAMDIHNRLQGMGYGVAAIASSGGEAVRKTAELRPDLVLMDITLGKGMDGIETANRIHAKYNIPVIYVSSNIAEDMIEQIKATNPFGFIVKPFEDRELRITMEMALYRHKMEEKLRQDEEKYRTILENIEEAYFEVDLAGNFTFFNDALCRLAGLPRNELLGMNNLQYAKPETAKKMYEIFNEVYRTGNPAKADDYEIIRMDGVEKSVALSASLTKDSSGNPTGFRGIVRDVTERKKAEERLSHLATHDSLTGLPNRILFGDRLSLELARARRSGKKLAVMLLDLDHFKDINDTWGHDMGDEVLKTIGRRLPELLRKSDSIARMGGDEFLILLPEIEEAEDARILALKILDAFKKPFAVGARELYATTSIGIAIYPDDGTNPDMLMKKADMAMYSVKKQGRNDCRRYAPGMSPDVHRKDILTM